MITKESNHQNPLWYKDAIIYQLHVRAFHDSNDDGIGDFRGLIGKLDYLSSLGVTAIWLLPFYPSPLRDDGYDIADYTNINPAYGTLADFQEFLHEAHRRNMRVITELVINHTSDQHEWFQKSRRAPPGSFWRDFYVWSDDPRKYKGTRIIFKDFETSNWAWDPVAKSYYWHRFYSHQPDLNFDNPEVQKALFKALDFWMEMGVDGMRLDAVPYLFEREGTSNENLPETHEFLKKLRSYMDERYPGTMLLAEANQWPEDAVNYFGEGDECHMNFHFPLMPRLFMALKMEDRYSIIDILKQTPEIPDNCQWAIFLRNHDELTLEMVTDEERDYMYRVYASDPRARINLGVRRRLAPLVGNDRRQIELLNSLLFSLPGSPIIYYGDEIGMGDNIYLGDRDGVRTPFQWNLDRNAGFSKANPQRLYLPLITTPEYHSDFINVENLKANPTSLLWWMTRLISLRSSYPALSRGKFSFVDSTNPKVLTYMREWDGEAIVCVVNLSRNAQATDINLSDFKGESPVEILGQVEFPPVGENAYTMTLAPYSFYWLQIPKAGAQKKAWMQNREPLQTDENPLPILAERGFNTAFIKRLKEYLLHSRWFAGKTRKITTIESVESFPIGTETKSYLTLIKVNYSEGLPENYLLGLGYAEGEAAEKIKALRGKSVITETGGQSVSGIIYDALGEADFCKKILETIMSGQNIQAQHGKFLAEYRAEKPAVIPDPLFGSAEQSNSSLVFGKELYLKFYRRIEEGENPEVEIGRYLSAKEFAGTAPYLGSLSYKQNHIVASLAIVQKALANEGDGWTLVVNQVAQLAERILTEGNFSQCHQIPPAQIRESLQMSPSEDQQLVAGYTFVLAQKLGAKTAEMHQALGVEDRETAFMPEMFTPFYQRSVFQSFRNLADRTLNLLRKNLGRLEDDNKVLAQRVLDCEKEIYDCFAYMKNTMVDASRIRIHGDYHLGQVLFSGQDFYVIDFEGEPARGIGERKIKRSPLKDVAGMMRSFSYAAEFHLRKHVLKDEDRERLEPCLHAWAQWAGIEYLRSYLASIKDTGLLPADFAQTEAMLQMYILEKALYEVAYELNNRPDWVSIPLRGVLGVLGKDW